MMCNIARSLAANNAPTIFTESFPNYDATESGNRSATFPELIGKKYILIRGNRNYERTLMSAIIWMAKYTVLLFVPSTQRRGK